MNSPKNASAAAATGGPPPSPAERILELAVTPAIEWPSTSWDEPALDWGPRRDDPLWGVRKAFDRERMLDTW